MPAETAPLRGGDLNAAVTSAVVGIQNKYLGRGPKSASTFHKDNVIVTLLYDVLTKAEQTLAATAQEDAVTHMRHLLQRTMQADFTEAVERLTGAKVVAFLSGNNINPDVASELFILDRSLAQTTPPA